MCTTDAKVEIKYQKEKKMVTRYYYFFAQMVGKLEKKRERERLTQLPFSILIQQVGLSR